MKILYSCLSRSWGGMEMFTLTAINELINAGHEVDLICYPQSSIQKTAELENINVIPIKADKYFHPSQILKLKSVLTLNKYDLIHTQASKDLWVIVPALKIAKSKIPLFLTKQVGSFIVKKDFLHKLIYRRVTTAFAISEIIKENLLESTPLKGSQIKILHNAVDIEKFDPDSVDRTKVRSELGIKEEEIVIGMLARFSWGKGHEEFLESAKLLVKNFQNLKFLIVGESSRGEDDYGKKIKKMAVDYGLKERAIFTGYRSDTSDVLAAMDIFVFPSHSEAFGIALVEAMAMKVASVCAASDGVLDICVDDETGLFFEKQNPESLTHKIEELIGNGRKREILGNNARDRVIKKFDIKINTQNVINYYNDFVK